MEATMIESEQTTTKSISKLALIICLIGALFYCYEYLLRIAPAAMVPELMQAFDLRAETFGALISLYYLAYTPTQLVVGVLHDYYGPKRVLGFAVIVCILGSLLFGNAPNVMVASVGRLMLGFGSAFAFVGALKLASVWLPSNRFGMFSGFVVALGMLGGMFGNVGMSEFVNTFGWEHTYTVGALSGFILLFCIIFIVKDSPKGHVISKNSNIDFSDMGRGMLQMVKNPQIWLIGGIGCMLYLSLSVFAELWGDQYVHTVYAFPEVDSAKIVSMIFVGWLIGAPVMGLVSDKLHKRRLPIYFAGIVGLITSTLIVLPLHLHEWVVATLFFIFGFACSAQVLCFALGKENAPPEMTGAAIAIINMMVMCGGLLFQPIVGKLLDVFWTGGIDSGIRLYSPHDFELALLILPLGCLISLILTLFLKETHAKMIGESIAK